MNEAELRAYLLGEATEEEAARLEGRLLEDDELYQVLESVEDDLLDDHARGRLDAADRARFEARYGADGERQRFARAAFPAKFCGSRQARLPQAVPHRGILKSESNGFSHLLDRSRVKIFQDAAGNLGKAGTV